MEEISTTKAHGSLRKMKRNRDREKLKAGQWAQHLREWIKVNQNRLRLIMAAFG